MPRLYGLSWLAKQSCGRWRRTKWHSAEQLGEELWTVMCRLRDEEPPEVTVPTPAGPTTIINTTIVQTDLTFPQQQPPPTNEPNPEDPTITTRRRTLWQRDALPCKVGSKTSGRTYNVTLYPYGDMTPLEPSDPPTNTGSGDVGASEFTIATTALQLQIDTSETIPEGSWTIAVYMQQFRVTETLTDGAVTGSTLELLQSGTFMQVPIWL